jgi:hypothetical protein
MLNPPLYSAGRSFVSKIIELWLISQFYAGHKNIVLASGLGATYACSVRLG